MRDFKEVIQSVFKVSEVQKKPTVLSVVSHRDKKIGNHFDFRLVHPGGAISWSSKRPLPKAGKIHTLFESSEKTPEHLYFDEANLPEGEDRVHIGHHRISLMPTEHGTHRLVVHEGEMAGEYELKHSTGNQWLVKHVIPEPEKAADFLNSITLSGMQRFCIFSSQSRTSGPLTGYPDMSKAEDSESISSKGMGAIGTA